MTIDEAIKHCLEVAEKNDGEAEVYNLLAKNHNNTYEKLTASKFYTDCAECAADHRQLAEWLTELKELRILVAGDNTLSIQKLEMILAMLRAQNNDNDIALCELCEKAVKLQDREAELKEAKRLLKLAVEDLNCTNDCVVCMYVKDNNCPDDRENCGFKWRYADEALKLIES